MLFDFTQFDPAVTDDIVTKFANGQASQAQLHYVPQNSASLTHENGRSRFQ
jgi:hypothetical protein